ncbi:hypothetical protein [Hymenobacter lucidus]|uniref:Uncharacterized protein n=1 Tax=Hymenobacter lucidus TaxID=2880930 RepID=A0ABS8AV56_9BACT|nr:hypothetical protein [Hymenobacter lucidus]MCB2409261.1 hypothetical protein [Hymenobacter lucidus]
MPQPPVFYLFLVLCLLLAGGLTLAAVRRPHRQRLWPRLLAGWLAVLALWWLAYPPRRTVSANSSEIIVLTPGYQTDSVRQLLRKLGPATTLWRYGFSNTTADTPSLHSLQLLRERYPELRRLHLLGWGLPVAALPELGPLRLIMHRPTAVRGFQQAGWNRRVEVGQRLVVEGFFTAASAQPVWLSLRGAGRPADSVRLPAGTGPFRLQTLPKTASLAVYQLVARQGRNLLATEPVPVEVSTARPLRVLLLNSTASFEFTALKNYLGTQQHRVGLRTGLSRGLAQTEFLNQTAHDLTRVSSALLAHYDVVVTDAATIAAFSSFEVQVLRESVRTNGLGLILLAEPTTLPRALPSRAGFTVVPRPTAAARSQPIRWPESTSSATTLIPATLRLAAPARPLVTNRQRQAVVATQRFGLGSVTVSVLPQTYPWVLQGDGNTYATYWSTLLRAAARPLPTSTQWQVVSAWPRAHDPVALLLTSSVSPDQQPTVAGLQGAASVPLALAQAALLSEWQSGVFWPAGAGWHQVQLKGQLPYSFYVFGAHHWLAPEQRRRQQAAQNYRHRASANTSSSEAATSLPYPAAWFFGLFLLTAGFLWLEEKL